MSLIGSQVSIIALPIVAVSFLNATSVQTGILTACSYAAFLALGLPAGIWVDRYDKRKLMIISDIGRAAVLALVPLLFSMSMLNIQCLYIVALINGVFNLIFDVSHQSYLPELVDENYLVEGNTKLASTYAGSQIVGPSLGGLLTHLFYAPFVIFFDSVSYIVSALLLSRITTPIEKKVKKEDVQSNTIKEIKGSLEFVFRNPLLSRVVTSISFGNFFDMFGMVQAILPIFILNHLGLSPLKYGAILAFSNTGALLGSILNTRIVNKFGFGKTILIGASIGALPLLMFQFVDTNNAFFLLSISLFTAGFGVTLFNVNQLSLRQKITPIHMMGRMNATVRFIIWGTIPLGAMFGGWMGKSAGFKNTFLVAAIGAILSVLPLCFTDLLKIRSIEDLGVRNDS